MHVVGLHAMLLKKKMADSIENKKLWLGQLERRFASTPSGLNSTHRGSGASHRMPKNQACKQVAQFAGWASVACSCRHQPSQPVKVGEILPTHGQREKGFGLGTFSPLPVAKKCKRMQCGLQVRRFSPIDRQNPIKFPFFFLCFPNC